MSAFVPVTNITLSPDLAQLIVGQATSFNATVVPSNATNKTIVWSRVEGVQCTISQNQSGNQFTINPQASGTVKVRATIANGKVS